MTIKSKPNSDLSLTREQARRFLLQHQGLSPPRTLRGRRGVQAFLRRVGCIQFDPLDVVGRNPDLVLQARVRDYRPELLRRMLYHDRDVLDGFDKVASVHGAWDWPAFRRAHRAYRKRLGAPGLPVSAILPKVRAAFKQRGPLSSIDLEFGEIVRWDWSTSRLARAALDSMFYWGELVVHHRVHSRKIYDLAQRALPPELLSTPDPHGSERAYREWRVLRRIGGVGLLWARMSEAWLGISSMKSPERRLILARLLEAGKLLRIRVDGIADPLYVRAEDWTGFKETASSPSSPRQAVVIAPLDNLLWDRRLLKALFEFDYRWEVYVPPERRRYGYYVLPVLYGDRFVARFDPARDPERGVLVIKNWWWEKGVKPSPAIRAALRDCFREFLAYAGASRLEVQHEPREKSGLDGLRAAAGE
ncbi:MAG: crosslink repair DNA glycosylase YcaQ family protein [Anaerolineales bacterium]